MSERPIKIAVVGGGCAAMAAAFELTRAEHRGRYEVTVYQLGWRLGGKGASGRGPAGRIEEHGLHIWMGFYENAFRLMRECYAELGRDPASPLADWRDAFTPAPFVGIVDQFPTGGAWMPWSATLPPTDGLPGDPYPGGFRWSVLDYFQRSAELVRTLLGTLAGPEPISTERLRQATAGDPQALVGMVAELLKYGELASLTALVEAAELVETAFAPRHRFPDNLVTRLLDGIAANARSRLTTRAETDLALRRLWTIVDLTLATMRGMVRFGLLTDPRGFDAIDEYDCREWLRLNGATDVALDSGYLRALYDLGFSYANGDPARPGIAAGQALRSMVRAFFTYRGSFFWRMQAGMGDVVFAPLYEVLRRRGVRFEFFHRLVNVGLGPDGETPHVASLSFDVQAEVTDGRPYEPLVDVRGLPCWPSQPDWSQLVDGARQQRDGWQFESAWDRRRVGTRTCRVGEDFDLVVLGLGLGAVPETCGEILARDPRWRAMVDHVKTVPTQAFQIWMSADMPELGWRDGAITLSGFVEPFDTWADMGHLLEREAWEQGPKALAYFCSVLPEASVPGDERDPEYPARAHTVVRDNAMRFLEHEVGHLWPNAASDTDGFRWDMLVDPAGRTSGIGAWRFLSQFWTANVNPSDRYALSLPGSSGYRISPLDRTYDNLTIAGDWTACGFNAGCVEAAVMSGRLAAHALSLTPALDDIIGFDHP